jgi:hypothetical protein
VARLTGRRLAVAVAAAAVVIAGGVAVGPALARGVSQVVGGQPKVSVTRIDHVGRRAIVASGTVGGKPWQIEVMKAETFAGTWVCAPAPLFSTYCQIGIDRVPGSFKNGEPAILKAAGQTMLGRVRPDVARVRVRLSDGVIIDLRPATAYERHWVGLVMPVGATITMVTAYAHGKPIAHSTPFVGADGNYDFLTWLPPGVNGPAIATKDIGPRVVPGDQLYVGPWGNCVGWPDQFTCWPLGTRYMSGSVYDYPHAPVTPRSVVIAVRPDIAYLQLTLSNGRVRRVHTINGAGVGFIAYKVTEHPRILQWGLYDSAGRRLSAGHGPPDSEVQGA